MVIGRVGKSWAWAATQDSSMAATRHGTVNGLRIIGIPCLTNYWRWSVIETSVRADASFVVARLSSR
jgi:hypothetical protein